MVQMTAWNYRDILIRCLNGVSNGNFRVAFIYMDKEMMWKIVTCMVLPRLECTHRKKVIKKLERIQRTNTKMMPELRDLEYEDRLKEMGLLTLQDRRERGDLITMYKIIKGKEMIDRTDLVTMVTNETRHTRGHSRKTAKRHLLWDVKKFSFPHRTVDV